MGDMFLSDNVGRRVPPHVHACAPVAASGVTLTDAATGGDHTQTVVGGATYAFTCLPNIADQGTEMDDTFVFGLADATAEANQIWICPPYQTIIIQVPVGTTSLHYQSLANGGSGKLRRIHQSNNTYDTP